MINLNKLFETQKKLDDRIVAEKGLEGVDLLDYKILALQVELGELANEWRGFKFWSEDQEPRNYCMACEIPEVEAHDCHNPLLEEYVDCLHFILSIGNDLTLNERTYLTLRRYERHETTEIFNALFGHIDALHHQVERKGRVINIYNITFSDLVNLGNRLGFTTEQIEQAYYDKNKVNHERQDSGY